MIEKKPLQKLLHSITRRHQGLSDHNLMHPEREWYTGLLCGIVLLGVGVVWCMNLYWKYNDAETVTQISAAADQTVYRASDVERALSEFKDRNQTYENLKQELERSRPVPLETFLFRAEAVETATTTEDGSTPEEIPTLSPSL